MVKFSEKEAVQELLEILTKLGWEYLDARQVYSQRGSFSNALLRDIFLQSLIRLNPFLSEKEAHGVLRELEGTSLSIEGNRTVWEFLKGLRSVYIEAEKKHRNIKLLDQDPEKNTFHITREFTFETSQKTIRQDIVLFINGVPLLFVETKAPSKLEALTEALEQVRRYRKSCPQLLSIEQIFVITDGIDLAYGPTWNESKFTQIEKRGVYFKAGAEEFFQKEHIINLITRSLFFVRKDDKLNKVLLRPHQERAISKVIQRAKEKDKRRGLIWHTQGSGKTYTMIVSAQRMIEDPFFENPTIIMLVDRNELESQLFSNIQAVGLGNVELAQSKQHLQELLKQNYRGIIVSTIHKFQGMPQRINERENIIVLIDEAHRTTSGDLGNYLMGALPNATIIGFTGTPIDKSSKGKSTFALFGRDDEEGYLDKYGISESIRDGATLPLHYTLASNELLVEKELLEKEFLMLAEAEGISDVEELDKIISRAVNLRNFLKSRDRIEKVAKYVAEHYKNYVEPLGYKAFLVAVDREACALYKQELDKHLPLEYSKVVYSPHLNDLDFMKAHHLTEDQEKEVRKNFVDPDKLPKILIVTSKLLTGFDAPVLFCVYLDKPMRDHVLLQTIARVNRPYEDKEGRKKTTGLILDFVGIFENLQRALAFDSSDIQGIVGSINLLKERFKLLMEKLRNQYLQKIRQAEEKHKDFTLTHFIMEEGAEERRADFYELFKELQDLYDILSPDEFLREYVEDLRKVFHFYRIIRKAEKRTPLIDEELGRKFQQLVREHVKQKDIEKDLEIYTIDRGTIQRLEQVKASDIEKVFNLCLSIKAHAEKEEFESPYLKSISEQADRIVELYIKKQIDTKEALERLKKMVEEIASAEEEYRSIGMGAEEFTIYWLLKQMGISKAQELSREIWKKMKEKPYWKVDEGAERELRIDMLHILHKHMGKETLNLIEKILTTLRG